MAKKSLMRKAVDVAVDHLSGVAGLRKALNAGDRQAGEDALVKMEIPKQWWSIMVRMKELVQEYKETIEQYHDAEMPEQVEAERDGLRRMVPRTVQDVTDRTAALADAEKRWGKAMVVKSKLEQARLWLNVLEQTFPGLLTDGTPGSGRGGSLPPEIENLVLETGLRFDFTQHWPEAIKYVAVEPKKRRRLIAGGQRL